MRAPCTHARGVLEDDNEAFVSCVDRPGGVDGFGRGSRFVAPCAGSLLSKAPVYVPYSWTGFYVGLNGGGGFGNSSWDSTGNRNISGGLAGGTIGYNYQWGRAVFGVEGDIDWADIDGSTNNGCPLGCKTRDNWLSTVRGRLGYAADRFMPFITGGAAFGDIRASTPGFAGDKFHQCRLDDRRRP